MKLQIESLRLASLLGEIRTIPKACDNCNIPSLRVFVSVCVCVSRVHNKLASPAVARAEG